MPRHTGSFFKRYLAYRATREVAKGTAGVVKSTVKLLLYIFAVLVLVVAVPYALIFVAVVVLVVVIVCLVRRKKANVAMPPPGRNLRRDAEIVRDCQNLINNSENIETVAHRYQSLVSLLSEMQKRPQSDFDYYGVSFGSPISSILSSLESNKAEIFCQAIDRAFSKCQKHIAGLKTEKGKQNAVYKFHCDARSVIMKYTLPDACIAHLDAVVRSAL